MPELNARARQVLYHCVTEYVSTGEPVGSRTLSKKSGLDLSPASIRNVLADLEDLGYLRQPHTSAGRVPTDRAFLLMKNGTVQNRFLRVAVTEQDLERIHNLLDDVVEGRTLGDLRDLFER